MNNEPITIRKLYPDFNDQQLKIAEENLQQYLGLIIRMYSRIEQDETALAEFRALTEAKPLSILQAKVDSKQP